MWASGMVCTFFTFKLFDITSITNNSDIDLLAKRRLASNTPNMNSSPPSNVTVNFAGLADLMHGQNAVANAPDPIPIHPQPRHPPRISLDLFCVRYDISDNLHRKLVTLGIQGPHALRFLVDGDLHGEGKLLLGELGELRDAEERWKDGDGNEENIRARWSGNSHSRQHWTFTNNRLL